AATMVNTATSCIVRNMRVFIAFLLSLFVRFCIVGQSYEMRKCRGGFDVDLTTEDTEANKANQKGIEKS
ncbi:MAG TPA: hypothetical protein VIF81_01660, partial [Pyrinomonadaceae bacterium]